MWLVSTPENASADGERQYREGNSDITVGRFTYGHEGITIRQWGEGASLAIGSFCSLSTGITVFLGGNHKLEWITTFPFGHIYVQELGGAGIIGHPATRGNVSIGDDVWIGHGTTIMSGITIGAVIATNAHAVKDVAPYEIVGGNPAAHIRHRFSTDMVSLLLVLEWWKYPSKRYENWFLNYLPIQPRRVSFGQ